jgi:20S proteasome subunit alpha 2
MSEGRYSFSLTTFSPSGKLVQIEHALTAVSQGITSVGIKGILVSLPKGFKPMFANGRN